MLKDENTNKGENTFEGNDLIKSQMIQSAFHGQWDMINKISAEGATEGADSIEALARQNLKGRNDGLGKKIGKANIKDWKDQKLLSAGFFEWQKYEFFKDKTQIVKSFPNSATFEKKLPENWQGLEEDDVEFKSDKMTPEMRQNFDYYGDLMKTDYLENGLSNEEAKLRREFYGPNKLPEKQKTPEIIKLIMEITNVFSLLLWIAAALSLIGYGLAPDDKANLWLAVVIIAVILVTGVFSWYQNRKSDAIMDSFKNLTSSYINVTRGGQKNTKIPAIDLVPGDVVSFATGEKIPADLRIFVANELKIDEAPLTGESLPVKKKTQCGEKGKEDPLEATNLAFFSTLCNEGTGVGIVIKTGSDTFMGRIADLASSAEASVTTLQKEIDHFIKLIACIAVSFGVVFFILGVIIEYPIITNLIFALGIVVANVPEGLMSTVTISLAITAKKMLKKNVLVKNLQSVETLGAITCICSDKTGTLTQNKMTVVHLWYDMEIKKVNESQDNLRIQGEDIPMTVATTSDESFNLLRFSAVCGSKGEFRTATPEDYPPLVREKNAYTKAHKNLSEQEIGDYVKTLKIKYQEEYTRQFDSDIDNRITDTDASESGILKFFEKTENITIIRQQNPLHTREINGENKAIFIPFDSKLKFMYFIRRVQCPEETAKFRFRVAFKGAPEQLLERCTTYLYKGKENKMTKEFKEGFVFANKCFALKGERVIGIAYADLDPSKYRPDYPFNTNPAECDFLNGLTFAGIISMEDPPRHGVKEAILKCNKAGVKVIMVTGDQYLTAASIAHQVGIIQDLDDIPQVIMDKYQLSSLEEAESKSNTIIITGDRLAREMSIDAVLSEDNPRKGQFLRNCLLKRDVVFARTSPEQKLIIVDGCQKLQHVVAVTGDGVNDSPAIKKSDIGIAMGKVGTDVAKDAADILLLDDHFPNIVKGIKQGRVIFDILKKIIGYCLSSNIPELLPFLGFVVIQFPLPLTTILILCIDVGTDVFPMICFAYEAPEADLMLKKPRNVKTDKLCTLKLFAWGYFHMGIIEAAGAFLAYFTVMHDYGFKTSNLFFFSFEDSLKPSFQDVYNPYDDRFLGNSNGFINAYTQQLSIFGEALNVAATSKLGKVDWATEGNVSYDLRLFYFDYPRDFWGDCHHDSRGHEYNGPVCYRVEALRHAQAAFLLAVVILQVANAFCFRTKTMSIAQHIYNNHILNFAFFVEIGLIAAILYVPGLNTAFGTRPIIFEHWIPCILVFITMMLWAEITKILIRNVKKPDGSPGFFYDYYYY